MIWPPDPGHVGRTDRGENVMHMTPGSDIIPSTIAVDDCATRCLAFAPGRPPTVHLRVKIQEERMSPTLGCIRPAPDIGIIRAAIDIAQLEVRLIDTSPEFLRCPIDHRNVAVAAGIIEIDRL